MAYGDGSGPMGAAPMTGRGAGFCAVFDVPGFMNPGGRFLGRGMGRGVAGYGRGFRNSYGIGRQRFAVMQNFGYQNNAAVPAALQDGESEKNYLKSEAEYLKKSLDAITKRLEQLETAKSES